MSAQIFEIEVTPILPPSLSRLEELSANLWYSWDAPARALFERLDKELWIRVGHNPKLFLRNIAQDQLEKATKDPLFLDAYHQVLSAYDAYHKSTDRQDMGKQLEENDLIAYFCAEYGFHESLNVYSGGLGILAGDHCKTASDLRLPFVSVGLYYHQGYFSQLIDSDGNQQVLRDPIDPKHLPITLMKDSSGEEIQITVEIADKTVFAKIWKVRVGHITLYLLDSNVDRNSPEDIEITHQLYGGDQHTRIKQEILLGIGGVRLLRKLGLAPTVWHLNEGHAAFAVMERLRELIVSGHGISQATEAVAANTVFTTHTPVPAGHDTFPQNLVMHYLGVYAQQMNLSREEFLALGCWKGDENPDFNMTTLAINGSRQMNGVSQIHGTVSSEICAKYWPQIAPEENPMSYVTNGVHIPTFLSLEWCQLFDKNLGSEWRTHLCDVDFWKQIDKIPDQAFWNAKQNIKTRMLRVVRHALASQHLRNQISEAHLERMLRFLDPNNPNILTIGFARRFATYKRATLLFKDLDMLRSIITRTETPIVFIFAGKAHPADRPGQDLLKEIHRFSNMPEFVGRILLVQGYDSGLSRRLVSGVDIWLNNPIYPMEASGTSGMKAAINAAINLSVLDGWWAESYDGKNGWGIKPSPHHNDEALRDKEDAGTLYEILQDDVIPLYYNRGKYGYSEGWIEKAKRSMATILPRFNTSRMLNQYVEKFYIPAAKQGKRLSANAYAKAEVLAAWKVKIRQTWQGVTVRQLVTPPTQLTYGKPLTIQVSVNLNGLKPEDVRVELILSRRVYHSDVTICNQDSTLDLKRQCQENQEATQSHKFSPEYAIKETGEYVYALSWQPDWCGGLIYRIRAYPYHDCLANPLEMGMMTWVYNTNL